MGLSYAPSTGLSINPNIGIGVKVGEETSIQNSIAAGFNSRRGLKALTYQTNVNYGKLSYGLISAEVSQFDYTPTASLPFKNNSFMFHGTVGLEAWTVHPNIGLDGSFSRQFLAHNSEKQTAYGYMYLEDAKNSKDLMDYNSELKGSIKANTPYLPIAYGTPDYFSISGHGTGGQFKTKRNDVGIFRPGEESTTAVANSVGVELGHPTYAHFGANITTTLTSNKKKEWSSKNNRLKRNFQFSEKEGFYESAYFKPMGEMTPFQESGVYEKAGGTAPVRVNNQYHPEALSTGSNLVRQADETATTTSFIPNGKMKNEQRVVRNKVISYRTNQEMIGEVSNPIFNFSEAEECPHNIILRNLITSSCACGQSSQEEINRGDLPAHHIGEFTILEPNGSRYIYGLPVYNHMQKDVTFSIAADANDLENANNIDKENYGLINYEEGEANSVNNSKGDDHYFDATETPKYASNYLLTKVLTKEYIPSWLNEPNEEVRTGEYISFQYQRHEPVNKPNTLYKWRIPIKKGQAKFHQGLKSDAGDDKASYVYGEKELWYNYSIESSKEVVRFYTSPREDGLGVNDENGGVDENLTLLKLDSIALFNKADLLTNQEAAVPIKKAHFRYDYSLCKGVPNQLDNNKGKLTLKKIFFTYGNSRSGELNAYKFHYDASNQNYNIGHYDRWGNFQKNPSTHLPNHEYPFVLQDDNGENEASPWNLTNIDLPSGGKIEVTYEPDDYAWVQDRRAGQMMPILGFYDASDFDPGATPTISTNLYANDLTNTKYVSVDLGVEDDETPMSMEEIKERYLEGIEQVYFDCLIQLKTFREDTQERVSGYFTVDTDAELLTIGSNELLIPVKYLKERKQEIHPITFAALQKMRLELPELIFPGFKNEKFSLAFLKSKIGLLTEIWNFFKGFERNAMKLGHGKKVITANNASWLRLCNPNFKKIGGGSRVKQLTISDEWNVTNGHTPSKYGQKYTYTTKKEINGVEEEISSGVAAYEPGIGGEENLLKEPLPYEEKYFLAPKNLYYAETL